MSAVVSQRLVVVWPPFSTLDAEGQQRVVTHELTHAALAGVTSGRTPAWLTEGIALYVSDDRRIDQAARAASCRASCRRCAASRGRTRSRRLSGDRQAAAYAYASAATFYVAERFGRKRLLRLFAVFNDEDLAGHARPGRGGPRGPARARHLRSPSSSATSATGSPPRSS